MLELGFINPTSDYLFDPFKGDPHVHFNLLTLIESRLENQVNAKLIDLRGIKKEFIIKHIPECDVYLHSVYTLDWDEQNKIVKDLRERYPKAKHIAGGYHINLFPKESKEVFDSIILGEGEESIIKALHDFKSSDLKGVYQQEGRLDINNYPYPQRKYLPASSIARKGLLNSRYNKEYGELLSTTVVFSRGCPYSCSFCAVPQMKDYAPGIRFRRPEYIEEEIEYLKKEYNIGGISMSDEICIPLNPQKAVSHLEAIARTGIKWRGQCRVDGINSELAKLVKESGCTSMGMGVESISQKSLDLINKKISVEKSKEAIQLLKENGIETRLYMIIGLPAEPQDVVEQTWQFIKEASPAMVYLSLFTVRPGTEVYIHPENFGIEWINTDWNKTMHMIGRYSNEMPNLTFKYAKQTPWGESFSEEKIIENYMELQRRLKEHNLATL